MRISILLDCTCVSRIKSCDAIKEKRSRRYEMNCNIIVMQFIPLSLFLNEKEKEKSNLASFTRHSYLLENQRITERKREKKIKRIIRILQVPFPFTVIKRAKRT